MCTDAPLLPHSPPQTIRITKTEAFMSPSCSFSDGGFDDHNQSSTTMPSKQLSLRARRLLTSDRSCGPTAQDRLCLNLIETSDSSDDDDDSFFIARRLLRKRHVKKERMKTEREEKCSGESNPKKTKKSFDEYVLSILESRYGDCGTSAIQVTQKLSVPASESELFRGIMNSFEENVKSNIRTTQYTNHGKWSRTYCDDGRSENETLLAPSRSQKRKAYSNFCYAAESSPKRYRCPSLKRLSNSLFSPMTCPERLRESSSMRQRNWL